MHCVGEYPTSDENLQLNQIDLLCRRYTNVRIGYSTHESPDQFDAVKMAIAKGATIFEKHVGVATDKYALNGYSANPGQVRAWLTAARSAIAMCGVADRRHEFSEAEKKTLGELRRGVFAKRNLAAGEVIKKEDVFVAIPARDGQLVANDLSKYNEFRTIQPFTSGEPVLVSGTECTDSRGLLHGIVRDVVNLLKSSGAIVPAQLELEVSHHYGLERFREFGSTTVTVVSREYCKRVILMLPGQTHPEQWHKLKDETYHILHGRIELTLNGARRIYAKNDVVIIPREVRHCFSSASGAVIEEISSAYDQNDSYYTDANIMQNFNRKTYVTDWMD